MPSPRTDQEGADERSASPRVSVIAIFYNAERYFAEAIDSVLAQEFADFELLLVDDGSTDGSTQLAREYTARFPERVRCFDHPQHVNRGMSATRNLGIGQAHGEFVAFIDADDRWHPAKLGEQVAIFDNNPGVDAVFGAVNYWRSWAGGKDQVIATGHLADRPVSPPEAALRLYPLGDAPAPCPSDIIVRRSLVEALGGFEESFTGALQMYEDQAFLAKLYLAATIFVSSRNWIDYRIHEDSCVARVSGSGGYRPVRRHFLEWLSTYARDHPERAGPRVRAAIDRAMGFEQLPSPVRKAARAAGRLLRTRGR